MAKLKLTPLETLNTGVVRLASSEWYIARNVADYTLENGKLHVYEWREGTGFNFYPTSAEYELA